MMTMMMVIMVMMMMVMVMMTMMMTMMSSTGIFENTKILIYTMVFRPI